MVAVERENHPEIVHQNGSTNGHNKDFSPEEFAQRFSPRLTIEQAKKFQRRRAKLAPKSMDPTPLKTFIKRVGDDLPDVHRTPFINRAMSGILAPGVEVSLIPKEEDE